MIRLNFRSFLKNKGLVSFFFIFFVGTLLYPLRNFPSKSVQFGNDIWAYSYSSQMLSIFCFIVFLFLSYEFFMQIKQQNLQETVFSLKGGFLRYYGSRAAVLLSLDALLTLLFSVTHVIAYLMRPAGIAVLGHVILSVILNIFCVSAVAILIGMALSLLQKRLLSYTLMVCMVFLGSPLMDQMIAVPANDGVINLYWLYRLFNFYPPNLTFTVDCHTGMSVLPWRWALIGSWCCLSLVAVFFYASKGKGKKMLRSIGAGFGAFAILLGAFAAFPGSTLELDRNPKGTGLEEQCYYQQKDYITKEEPASFQVRSYTLDLKVRNQVRAEVEMKIDSSLLTEFKFTLYHTFQVKKVVTQDGTSLAFTREGDYISVKNTDKKTVTSLKMSYEGYSPCYYSNMQGVFLPGSFTYYPRAGYERLNSNGPTEAYIDRPLLLAKSVPFTVAVDAPYPLFSNLKQTEPGRFSGITDGVTLISGFLKQVDTHGISVIYPYSSQQYSLPMIEEGLEDMEAIYQTALKLNPNTPDWRRQTLIITPNVNQMSRAVFGSDQIIMNGSYGKEDYSKLLESLGIQVPKELNK